MLKPLSKDEQKRILNADNKKDKNSEIEKIRSKVISHPKPIEKKPEDIERNLNLENKEML